MTLPERLLHAIKIKDISYRELSNVTGIPKSAIQRYVTGETTKIPFNRLKALALALNVSQAWLMDWEDNTFSPPESDAQEGFQVSEPEPPVLSPPEAELVSIYRSMNQQGQETLLSTARAFAGNPDMQKEAGASASA